MPTDVTRPGMLAVLIRGWALVLGTAMIFGLGALALSLVQKPVYEASTTLYVTAGGTGDTSASDTVAASKERMSTYAELVYSDAVLAPALEAAGLDWSLEEARKSIGVETSPETVILTIYVRAPDPQNAQAFAGGIADSMTQAVSKLEAPGSGFEPAAKVFVVTAATVASEPVTPTTEVNVVLAALFGLFVGALLVLLRAALDKKVRDTTHAEAILGTPTLAVLASDDRSKQGRLVDFDGEPTPAATSFRNLRSRLIVELRDQPHPKLLITSANSAEGKTTVAVNVAAALAQAANRTVIVDANVFDPHPVQEVGAGDGPGLIDVIFGRIPLSDAVQRGVGGLDTLAVLGAGTKAVDHPGDLFSAAAFTKVLDGLAKQFDYVIIDAPALLVDLGTDAVLSSVDGVVVVTSHNVSTITELVACRTRLDNAKVRVLGLVWCTWKSKDKRSRHRKIEVNAR